MSMRTYSDHHIKIHISEFIDMLRALALDVHSGFSHDLDCMGV